MNIYRSGALAAPLLLAIALSSCSSNGSGDASAGSAAPAGAGPPFAFGFDDGTGGPPDGWRVGTSNRRDGSADAVWERRLDRAARSAPNVLALSDARDHVGQAFNVCWTPAVRLADVDLAVHVRADGGREDQGGGPAWRVAGANDYYVARWNPLEDNFRVYSVVGGERLQLDSARVRADAGAWHAIRVRHVGSAITCWFDGEELLHATDAKLRAPGGVGVWTKADATTLFDDLAGGPAGGDR